MPYHQASEWSEEASLQYEELCNEAERLAVLSAVAFQLSYVRIGDEKSIAATSQCISIAAQVLELQAELRAEKIEVSIVDLHTSMFYSGLPWVAMVCIYVYIGLFPCQGRT